MADPRSSAAIPAARLSRDRSMSRQLRSVLTSSPHTSHFSVKHIVRALGTEDVGLPVALFAAAGVFDAPDTGRMSGVVTSALGAKLALALPDVRLPRALRRRRIPRASLALLIHGIAGVLDSVEGVVRPRWEWVFHPAMRTILGMTLFLLGLASMAPIVGGGVQHAASAFLIAVGIAERDGLAVMIGALAGIACLALAALSVSSGRKLWAKVRRWLLQCARRLRLHAFSRLLDSCCEGLGTLVSLRWSGLLLVMIAPVTGSVPRPRREGPVSALRQRADRVRMNAMQSPA